MKKVLRIGMLLCSFILASVGWAKAQTGDPLPDLPAPFTQAIIDQTDLANLVDGQPTIGIFANGHSVYIEPSIDGNIQLRLEQGGSNPAITYTLDPVIAKHVAVFGGGYNNDIRRTYVYLEPGATIGAIVGGSYGTEAGKGHVFEATINMKGGTVLKYVVGGGVLYSKTEYAFVNASNNGTGESVSVMGWMIPCVESDKTEGVAYGDYDNSPCKVEKMSWTLNAGTYKYIGVAGGIGNKSYTKAASASISNATILGGIFGCGSNGRGNESSVSLNSCTIGDGSDSPVKIAAVNRGLLDEFYIGFYDCIYNANNKYHFNAGAAYDWSDGGEQADDEHRVTGLSYWVMEGSRSVPLEVRLSDGLEGGLSVKGLSVAAREFVWNRNADNPTTAFEIPNEAKWKIEYFNLYPGVTIEKKGTLSVSGDWKVASMDQLRLAVECVARQKTINLDQGTYQLSSPLVISKNLTLNGNGAIIEADPMADWPKDPNDETKYDYGQCNLISVEVESSYTTYIEHLTVQNSKGAGICAKTASEVRLTDVTLQNNGTTGLVGLAKVHVTDTHTKGNKWGGVYIDKGENTEENGKFSIGGGNTFEEDLQIWAYIGPNHIQSRYAVGTNFDNYYSYQILNEKDEQIWLWTNVKRNIRLTQEKIGDFTYVYANGYTVTVNQKEDDASKVVIKEIGGDDIIESEGEKTILFGGSKNSSVASSFIAIKSGKIYAVYGGGWGLSPEKSADVGEANLTATGGEVSHLMIGGGKGYARTKKLVFRIDDGTAIINEFYPGGDAEGITGNTLTTPLDDAYNSVKEVFIRIWAGTIQKAIGLGGGLGLTHTGKSDIIVRNITVGGVYGGSANGHAEEIYAQFANCKFEGGAKTIATLNKGMIDKIKIQCTDCQYAEDIQAYVGAAPGWGNTYSAEEPAPKVTGTVSYSFNTNNPPVKIGEGLANANVNIYSDGMIVFGKFFRGSQLPEGEKFIDVFEIGADRKWAFSDNVTFDTANPASLDIKGFLDMLPNWYYNLIVTSTSPLIIPNINWTMSDFVSDFNWANGGNPVDLSDKSIVFECKDGAIVSNKSLAKQWMAAGKNVQLLQYNADSEKSKHYSLVDVDPNETLQITNLPDSVAYGTAPIELAFNQPGITATITAGEEFAKIEDGKLTVLKPGIVTITLTTDDDSETATQELKITKRILTLTGGLTAVEKVYDGTTAIKLTKEDYAFTGLVGMETVSFTNDPTGVLTDANAGDNKQVTVTAELAADCADYYELAPITFVTANVTPKEIEIKANDVTVKYGETIPFATNEYQTALIGEDKLEGELKFSCTHTSSSQAGVYTDAITPYGLSSQNYQITYQSGSLTVEAFGPSIEITEHRIVKEGATTNIAMKAKLNHNGGAEIDKVTFTYKQDNVETPVTDMTEKDGIYTVTYKNMSAGKYELWVKAQNSAAYSGAAYIEVTVDEKTPQNLTWDASVLSTMVYGQEMTLSATSDQTAATGELSYSISTYGSGKAVFADPSRNIIKATKVGEFMINAKRAEDENYSPASLETKVNVVQKPITVSVTGLEKVYDGTTTIDSPIFTLTGVESGDDVSIDTENLALSFASKNVGEGIAVILPELTLTGGAAANYTLVQPTNVTGKITKAPLTIKVKDVTRPWSQRYTKYAFEATGLVNGETLAQAYTGNLKVTENSNILELNIDATKSPNYDVTAQNGTLTITKGMPKAVVYGSGSNWKGMIVDEQGHTGLQLSSEFSANGKLNVLDANGQVLTSSINSKPTGTSLAAASFSLRSASLRGTVSPSWNNASFTSVEYGSEAMTFSADAGFTYTSTNMSVLTVATDASNVTVTPVGVGNATIIAESTGEVKIWNVTVTPKSLNLTAEMVKTYDGTATATGTVSLTASDIVGTDDVALDLDGITFNYDSKNVGENKPVTPSQALVLIGTNANNYALSGSLTGTIEKKTLTVNDPIAVYYNGQKKHTLTTYPVTGLVAGDVAPIEVTFEDAAVGARNITSIALTTDNDALNYTLSSTADGTRTGTIQRSTLVATLPANASSTDNLKSNIQLAIRETGETVAANVIGFAPTITTSGSGANTVYSVTGGETTNYSVVYDRNQIGYAAPVIPGGGVTPDPEPEIPTVSNPVVAERTATTAIITWEKVSGATSYKLFLYAKKGDTTPLRTYEFDKDGNLKATSISFTLTELEDGKAYYIETAAYNALGTLLVKKSVELSATPTGIESIAEGSQLYTVKGAVVVVPAEPLQVAIYAVTGQTLFNDEVSYLTQVPAKAGIYVVVIKKGANTITEKVIVR